MATETQADFSGGLNTRLPAHRLPESQSTELSNVDLSFGDLRGEYGINGEGFSDYYYEEADQWVSGEGFSPTVAVKEWPASFTAMSTTIAAEGTAGGVALTLDHTAELFTLANHGFTTTAGDTAYNDKIQLSWSSAPTGLSTSTDYYVIRVSDDTFKIATTVDNAQAGTVLAFTGNGSAVKISEMTMYLAADANYFSNLKITDNATLELAEDGVDLEAFEDTKGVFGANSFVEYNDDLYISRTQFTVTGTFSTSTPANIKDINFGANGDTYKLQIGDTLSGTGIITDSVVLSIDTTNNKVVIDNAVTATVSSGDDNVTVKPIISRFLDGTTTQGYRASSRSPNPLITFSQDTSYSGTDGERDATTDPSRVWFSANYPIPFQYGVAHFDSTGLESSMSPLTDAKLSATYFDTAKNSVPVNVVLSDGISKLDRATSSDNKRGRYALYRVGGSSAFIKRVANLYLDSDLTVATTESTNNLQITLGGATDLHQYRLEWFVYDTGTSYRWQYADSSYLPSASAYVATGVTDWYNTSSGAKTFTLTGASTTHKADIYVWTRIPGEKVEREYVCRALTHNDANVATANTKDYIDFTKSDALIDIEPISVKNVPTRGLKYLAESGNLFFASKDTHLYVSDYGNPNSWRESSLIDFDQKITALAPMGLELIVFTEYGMFKIYGSDPANLKRVQIPTTEGVPDGANKCVAKFQQGIMFASHNGICFYNGQTVQRLTQNLLDTWALPNSTTSNNCGGFYEDVYYLLGTSGSGYKLDIRSSPMKLSRTTMTASNLFYRGAVNTLYAPTGRVNYPFGERTAFTTTTRKFTGGDINVEKVFYNVKISAVNFKGTVNVLVDGVQTDTFSIAASVEDYDRTLYLASTRLGNGIQIQLEDCYGEVHRVSVEYDTTSSITDRMFSSIQVQYTGTPTVQVLLDGVSKIAQTLSTPDGIVGEAKLYFPPMSNGVIVHFKETTGEVSGRVLNHTYAAEAV